MYHYVSRVDQQATDLAGAARGGWARHDWTRSLTLEVWVIQGDNAILLFRNPRGQLIAVHCARQDEGSPWYRHSYSDPDSRTSNSHYTGDGTCDIKACFGDVAMLAAVASEEAQVVVAGEPVDIYLNDNAFLCVNWDVIPRMFEDAPMRITPTRSSGYTIRPVIDDE